MMDFMNMLDNVPGLLSSLKDLGLDDGQVGELGEAVGGQLLGGGAAGLAGLLKGLDANDLLGRIDVGALAGRLGVEPGIAEAAIRKIAPHLQALVGGGPGGRLGSLAGGLFGKD